MKRFFLSFKGLCLGTIILIVFASLFFIVSSQTEKSGPFVVGTMVTLALCIHKFKKTSNLSFTIWIIAAVAASLYYPNHFLEIAGFQTKNLMIPLLQIIMFGMGTAMSVDDFKGVIRMPKGVLIGLICQLSIMPFIGYFLAIIMEFPPEIAAGIILVGSSPSGLASNVMAYLAKANLALSVTLTAFATLLAPITTPILMNLLAGEFVPIDFWAMMWSIIKIVILPIGVGVSYNYFFKKKNAWVEKVMPKISMIGIAVIITIITASGRDSLLEVGMLLIITCLIHNVSGYLLGYFGCKLARMDERSCRTIALEVGLQNGGLASGIALEMGKITTVGLASAVFGPIMNITGSTLASRWRNTSTDE